LCKGKGKTRKKRELLPPTQQEGRKKVVWSFGPNGGQGRKRGEKLRHGVNPARGKKKKKKGGGGFRLTARKMKKEKKEKKVPIPFLGRPY